jgi:hypothetical protein
MRWYRGDARNRLLPRGMALIGVDPDVASEGIPVHEPVGEQLYVLAPVVVGRVLTDVREGRVASFPCPGSSMTAIAKNLLSRVLPTAS